MPSGCELGLVAPCSGVQGGGDTAFLDGEIEALSTLCNVGLNGDHLAEARTAGTDALALVDRLPPERALPRLLEILPNLSDVMAGLGDIGTAATLGANAYALLREVEADEAHDPPDTDVRIGVRDIHAKRLSDQGESAEAVRVTREALDIVRSVATSGAVSTAPAHALVHLSTQLADLGDHDGALAAAREGLALVRALADRDPGWGTEELPAALHTLARTHWLRGELDEAAALTREMVAVNRRRMDRDEHAGLNDLASSLEFEAVLANAAGRGAEAIAAITEAVGLLHRLVDLCGDGFAFDLANGLHNAAVIALSAGDLDAAIDFQQQGVAALDRLPSWNANARKLAADGLANLGVSCAMAERVDEGLAATERACGIVEELASRWPPARETLIGARVARSRLLVLAGRHHEAVALADAALSDMDAHGLDWWRGPALNARAMALADLGHADAAEAAERALAFHHAALDRAGDVDDLHGYGDAAAVLIDVLAGRGVFTTATLAGILDTLAPWLDRLPPQRLAMSTAELSRALGEARPPAEGLTEDQARTLAVLDITA